MILEAFTYILTPANAISKRYGFLYASIALEKRFQRCKKAWQTHLQNCQELFKNTLASVPLKNSVVILGSAHLHEIPLKLILANFKNVILVDVQHPLSHHLRSLFNRRIQLVTQDLSQSLAQLDNINSLDNLLEFLANLAEKNIFYFEADLIISANILSQLGLLPIKTLERKLGRELTVSEKDLICTSYAEIHLKNLLRCNGKKLIYSDREVVYHDPTGKEIYRGNYPVNFKGFKKRTEWDWQLAPLKEASKDYSIQMRIQAYEAP